MTIQASLAPIDLLLGLIGSALLAVSLNRVVDALSVATDAHDVAIMGIVDPRPGAPIYVFTGTDSHLEAGRKAAASKVRVGLWLLLLSFALQAVAILVGA